MIAGHVELLQRLDSTLMFDASDKLPYKDLYGERRLVDGGKKKYKVKCQWKKLMQYVAEKYMIRGKNV